MHKTHAVSYRKPESQLWKLFTSILYISTFTFGGGFVIVTFMKKKFVDELHWIDEKEMLDFTAMAQSCPGAIAVNAAILIGWKIAGFAGFLTAVSAAIIPPMVIITLISKCYEAFSTAPLIALLLKGMQAGVAAVMMDVVCTLGHNVITQKSWISDALMVAAFLAAFVWNVNAAVIILLSIALAVGREVWRHFRRNA